MSQESVALTHRMIEAVNQRDLAAYLADVFPDFKIEVDELHDRGDVTVAALRLGSHGADSDTPIEQTGWYASRWRRGKCVWWRAFETRAEAVEAAGLTE